LTVATPHTGADTRALDRVAAMLLEQLAPLRFELARGPEDIEAAQRLRYECVVAEGWEPAERFPDGIERDEFDAAARHLLARDGEDVAGTARIVVPTGDGPGPIHRRFAPERGPGEWLPEVSRLVVAPTHRGGEGHPILAGLFARAWLEMRELGYDTAMGAATADLVDLFRNVGCQVTVIGDAKIHHGRERIAFEITSAPEAFSSLQPERV
jgi:N-acyl-L-homoserine lactone synthetase